MCELLPQFIIGCDPEALQSSLNPHYPLKKKSIYYYSPIYSASQAAAIVYSVRRFFAFTFYLTTQKSSY